MSELTLCNRCTLAGIERRAKKSGAPVKVVSEPVPGFLKGVQVIVANERVTWFAELTKECVC